MVNKKRLIFLSVFFVTVLIMSFVSAGFFSNVYEGMTGHAITAPGGVNGTIITRVKACHEFSWGVSYVEMGGQNSIKRYNSCDGDSSITYSCKYTNYMVKKIISCTYGCSSDTKKCLSAPPSGGVSGCYENDDGYVLVKKPLEDKYYYDKCMNNHLLYDYMCSKGVMKLDQYDCRNGDLVCKTKKIDVDGVERNVGYCVSAQQQTPNFEEAGDTQQIVNLDEECNSVFSCSENDGGITPSQKGTVTYKNKLFSIKQNEVDSCSADKTSLTEWYCKSGKEMCSKTIACDCELGACVGSGDGGSDDGSKGTVGDDFVIIDPNLGDPCFHTSETDRGLNDESRKNYTQKGRITLKDNLGFVYDQCTNNNQDLIEYYCNSVGPDKEKLKSISQTCALGCEDGHCKTCEDTDDKIQILDWPLSYGKQPNDAGVTRYSINGIDAVDDVLLPNKQDKCSADLITLNEKYCERVNDGNLQNPKYRYVRKSYDVTCPEGCEKGLPGFPDRCKGSGGNIGNTDINLKTPVNEIVFTSYPIGTKFTCEVGGALFGLGNLKNVTIYTNIFEGSFKPYYTLNYDSGYSCGINKQCFDFNIPFSDTGPEVPNVPVYPVPVDGYYKWGCVGAKGNNLFYSSENRTFILVRKEFMLIYKGGMLNPVSFDEDQSTSLDISSFDNYFDLFINGVKVTDKKGITYTASSSNLVASFLSRTTLSLTNTPKDWNGKTTLTFTAHNGSIYYDMSPLDVTVNPMNDAPYNTNNVVQWKTGNSTIIDLNNYFSDPDGNSLKFSWGSAENIVITNTSNHELNFTCSPLTFSGQRNLTINASDGLGGFVSSVFSLSIKDVNHPPVINSYSPSGSSIDSEINEKTIFSVNASDSDGDTLSYYWTVYKSNSSFVTSGNSKDFNFSTSQSGSFNIKVAVSDGGSDGDAIRSWALTVGGSGGNTGGNCGNNQIDSGEVCDELNLNGRDCSSQGYDSGELACSSDCKSFDTTLCVIEDTGDLGPDEGDVNPQQSKTGTYLIWGLIIVLIILIIVGVIFIIRIIKKKRAAVKSPVQTWQQPRPFGGSGLGYQR